MDFVIKIYSHIFVMFVARSEAIAIEHIQGRKYMKNKIKVTKLVLAYSLWSISSFFIQIQGVQALFYLESLLKIKYKCFIFL